jgi:hypothetical protein
MLTIAECREYLDQETSACVSDKELERIRDDLYKLARIILAAKRDEDEKYENTTR